MVQALAGAAQGGVSLATRVSYAMRQRRELPLEPHPRTGSRGAWAALFVPTVLQHAWEQAALPKPLSIPATLSNLFACGIISELAFSQVQDELIVLCSVELREPSFGGKPSGAFPLLAKAEVPALRGGQVHCPVFHCQHEDAIFKGCANEKVFLQPLEAKRVRNTRFRFEEAWIFAEQVHRILDALQVSSRHGISPFLDGACFNLLDVEQGAAG